MITQKNLAYLKFYPNHFKKIGIKILVHKFCKNQQVIKYIDNKDRKITKQIFNPDEFGKRTVIFHCPQGLPLDEVF